MCVQKQNTQGEREREREKERQKERATENKREREKETTKGRQGDMATEPQETYRSNWQAPHHFMSSWFSPFIFI